MQARDLVAVPKGVSNQRRRAFEDEFANGSVTRAKEVDAEITESGSMRVLGCTWRLGRVLGNIQGLSVPAPVRRSGRVARCSLMSDANGSGTSVGCVPNLTLMPGSLSSTMLVGKVTTLTSGWA
ncbi:hypothetical protein ACIBW9_37320 [Streptomyces sp. NPDC049541]|uniref:hypothetical protein n=1 Tax=Streptomyces sp. NPDC049541 TaxID=3365594 RepID=UPI0037976076